MGNRVSIVTTSAVSTLRPPRVNEHGSAEVAAVWLPLRFLVLSTEISTSALTAKQETPWMADETQRNAKSACLCATPALRILLDKARWLYYALVDWSQSVTY